jgi:hypothetical protein
MSEILFALLASTATADLAPAAPPSLAQPPPALHAPLAPRTRDGRGVEALAGGDRGAHLAWLARRWSWYGAHEATVQGRGGALTSAAVHEIRF